MPTLWGLILNPCSALLAKELTTYSPHARLGWLEFYFVNGVCLSALRPCQAGVLCFKALVSSGPPPDCPVLRGPGPCRMPHLHPPPAMWLGVCHHLSQYLCVLCIFCFLNKVAYISKLNLALRSGVVNPQRPQTEPVVRGGDVLHLPSHSSLSGMHTAAVCNLMVSDGHARPLQPRNTEVRTPPVSLWPPPSAPPGQQSTGPQAP